MKFTQHRVTRRLKSVVESALGVYVSRTPPSAGPGKHADQAIQRLRQWSSHDVVFDVGANDGRTILRLHEQLSRPRIFAFEPVPSIYRKLVARTAHLPYVRTYQMALGAENGRRDMYVGQIDSMSSFSPGWTAGPAAVEPVDVMTIDQVMAEQAIDFIHFLKIDTEGHELEVLKGAECALLSSRVAIVQLEVGVDQMAKSFLSFEQARCYLSGKGYLLHSIHNQCTTPAQPPEGWSDAEVAGYKPRVLGYCDALFIRANLRCEAA